MSRKLHWHIEKFKKRFILELCIYSMSSTKYIYLQYSKLQKIYLENTMKPNFCCFLCIGVFRILYFKFDMDFWQFESSQIMYVKSCSEICRTSFCESVIKKISREFCKFLNRFGIKIFVNWLSRDIFLKSHLYLGCYCNFYASVQSPYFFPMLFIHFLFERERECIFERCLPSKRCYSDLSITGHS